jgi:hypothetical protein
MVQTIQTLLKQAGFDKLPQADLAELLQPQ